MVLVLVLVLVAQPVSIVQAVALVGGGEARHVTSSKATRLGTLWPRLQRMH